MKKIIINEKHDEERAFYGLRNAELRNPVFDGPADGESALKESSNIDVYDGSFNLRYPLWHCSGVSLKDCTFAETCRAPIWYTEGLFAENITVSGVKCLRECKNISIKKSDITSEEFGWRCSDVILDNSKLTSVYAFFESKDLKIGNLDFTGKYSFQYVENASIRSSVLKTKDAFWHSKNVTVVDSVIDGEYLGWYSENLTLLNCKIKGTQPFCYCKGLRLINCTMEDTDLSFEYSEVEAEINGSVLSVKNPLSGTILADSYGEIILSNSVKELNCDIKTRK